jgi:hypothetical protein
VSHGSGHLTGGQEAHVVHFYPADGELAASASRYLADGIRSGDGVVVVATEPHRDAFVLGLAAAGVAVGAAERDGRLLLVDAAGLLATFFDGDRLDRDRFQAAAYGLLGRAGRADGPGGLGARRRIRIYAEMVALLWDAGQVSLAIELEELWNGLAARFPFGLLCGYPASVLDATEHTNAVVDVRRLHGTSAEARSFHSELDSVRAARHYVAAVLEPSADQALADDAAIVVTEFASNAVVHGKSAFTVVISLRPASGRPSPGRGARIRIAVRDNAQVLGSVPFPVTAGHGLSVVAQLASRWGVEPVPAGKVVWAELGAS